jgi:hypothetical protein
MSKNKFGTPAHMLTRTEDPDTSHDAGEAVDTTKREEQIYNFIASFDQEKGCTAWEVQQRSDWHPWSVSPRFKGLERKGHIYYLGDKRKGNTNRMQRVIRVNRRKLVTHVPMNTGRRHDDPRSQMRLL